MPDVFLKSKTKDKNKGEKVSKSQIKLYLQKVQSVINNNPINGINFTNYNRPFYPAINNYNSERNRKNTYYSQMRATATKTQAKHHSEMKSYLNTKTEFQQKIHSKSVNRKFTLEESISQNAFRQEMSPVFNSKKAYKERSKTQTFQQNSSLLESYYTEFDTKYCQSNIAIPLFKQTSEKIQKQVTKEIILDKIKTYVQRLDINGQQQLNNLLIESMKKRKKYPINSRIFEIKVKELIKINRYMVEVIKEQLLKQNIPKQQELEIKKEISQSEFQKQKNEQPQNIIPQNQIKQAIIPQNTPKNNNHQLTQSQQVTKQFLVEWEKGISHRKIVYNKFRNTLFQKFPVYEERQRALLKDKQGLIHQKQSQKTPNKQTSTIFNNTSKKTKSFYSPLKTSTYKFEKTGEGFNKNINHIKQSISLQKFQSFLEQKSNLKEIKNSQNIDLQKEKNSTELPRNPSLSNLSLKKSISKMSQKSIQILSNADKQQLKVINFENLIEFIFKKAYFYSKSWKRVLQNKAPFQQTKYEYDNDQKGFQISFLKYQGKFQDKMYLRSKKFANNKNNRTGRFLIKNKFNIMNIQKEGCLKQDFLKKCLEDAIDDYLRISNPNK